MFKRIHSLVLITLGLSCGLYVSVGHSADKEITWVGCGISKLGFMQDLAKAYEKKAGIKINLAGGGATKGLRQVASGQSNLGGSCRLPLVSLKRGGSGTVAQAERNIKLIPVGWDALVVIVHKDNSAIDTITRDQLRDVLTGKITNWKQLGSSLDKPINLYVRKGKISGVGLTLRQQLFDNVDQEFAAHATVLPSSGKIEKAVEKDPLGLAVSGISSSRHRQVRMLSLEGVQPTMEAMKHGEYKLYRILFLIAPVDYETNPALKGFVDFALSLDGQDVIIKAGTLPYHKGIGLLRKTSYEYIRAMETIDQQGMYTLGGH
jgi:phosphate transport system substrate-binding protein